MSIQALNDSPGYYLSSIDMAFCQDLQQDPQKYFQQRAETYYTLFLKTLEMYNSPKTLRVTDSKLKTMIKYRNPMKSETVFSIPNYSFDPLLKNMSNEVLVSVF